jgi:hypothetical protein
MSELTINDNGVSRPMTAEEEIEHNARVADLPDMVAQLNALNAAKESAKAKLAALGLTEDEVNAIIGGI